MLVKLLHLLPWQQVFYLFLSLASHWSFVVISAKRSLNILWSGRRQREYKMLWKVGEICEKKEQSRVRQGNLFYRGDLWSCREKKFSQELVCLSLLGKYLIRAQLFKRQITQSNGWITIHWVSVKKTSCTTHRIEIYLIYGFVNPSNNRGQVSFFWLSAIFNINR